ncbi:hypothetical protein CBL_14347 [Carabus blaptoides fortunei]
MATSRIVITEEGNMLWRARSLASLHPICKPQRLRVKGHNVGRLGGIVTARELHEPRHASTITCCVLPPGVDTGQHSGDSNHR